MKLNSHHWEGAIACHGAGWILFAGLLLSCVSTVAGAPQVPGLAEQDQQIPERPSIFVPAPREIARPFSLAQRALAEGQNQQAVTLLGELLSGAGQEDFLIPSVDEPYLAVSLHAAAQKLLGQIPRRFRESYELRYSVEARQKLEAAVSASDYAEMAKVFRHYFYTEAGFNAAMLLGHHYLELGQPVSAAAYLSPIVEHADARQKHDPSASILLATCWLLANQPARAEQVLIDFKARATSRSIAFLGRETKLFDRDDQALPWLIKLVGESTLSRFKSVDQWLMFRGNPQRTAESGTGFPLRFPRWQVPTINDPDDEALARKVWLERTNDRKALIPSVQPLAVGNTVIIRSLDRMIGVDFTTGKRVWEFPAWQEHEGLYEGQRSEQLRRERTQVWHVEQRMWDDHLYGQCASNGELVFVVDRPGYARAPVNAQAMGRLGGLAPDPMGDRETNELKAVELSRQGAFRWEVGGPTGGNEPQLKNSFFLGPPLSLENKLYALCELAGELRLVVLDDQTGHLLWSQQVAAIDAGHPAGRAAIRRLAGATPSFSDGILVCPTSASGIIAMDLATGSLLWGVQYPSEFDEVLRGNMRQFSAQASERRFSDAVVTISNSRVIAMPVESSQILCFDLLTGRSVWGDRWPDLGVPNDGALFVATVYNGQVIVLAENEVRSLRLETGEVLWRASLSAHGVPSGRGFLTDSCYFFPTTASRILKLDLNLGEVVESVETDRILGNLICFGGDVVSHGYDVVATYRQTEHARQFVEGAERTGMQTIESMTQKAQLLSHDGKTREAVEAANQAWERFADPTSKDLLLDLIIDLMGEDFVAAERFDHLYANELNESRRYEYLSARFKGLVAAGNLAEATRTLVAIARDQAMRPGDENSELAFVTAGDAKTQLRVDRWMQFSLAKAVEANATELATAAEVRAHMAQIIGEVLDSVPTQQLTQIIDWIGESRIPEPRRLELAREHAARRDYLTAERLLMSLLEADDTQIAGQATAVYLRMLLDTGWARSSHRLRSALSGRFANQTVYQGKTGADLVRSWLPQTPSRTAWNHWPQAGLHGEVINTTFGTNARGMVVPRCRARTGHFPESIQVEFNPQMYLVVIRDEQGHELGVVSFQSAQPRVFLSVPRLAGEYSLHGHLLILNTGVELVAIDLFNLQTSEGLLWQRSMRPKNQDAEFVHGLNTSLRAGDVSRFGENRVQLSAYDKNLVGHANGDGAGQVFYRIGTQVYGADAFTGQTLWRRESLSPLSTLMMADDLLAVLDFENARTIEVLDPSTGAAVKTVNLPPREARVLWSQFDGLSLFAGQSRDEQFLELIDPLAGKVIWERSYPHGTLGSVVEERTMVLYQPGGRLEYLDLRSGQPFIETSLGLHKRIKSLRVLRLADHDVIVLNRHLEGKNSNEVLEFSQSVRIGGFGGLVDGYLYCIDRIEQKTCWTSPVQVEDFFLPTSQPKNLPLLLCHRWSSRQVPRTNTNLLEFYLLDLRNGRLAHSFFRSASYLATSVSLRCDVASHTIDVGFGNQMMQLRYGALPGALDDLPPSAPASLTNAFTFSQVKSYLAETQAQTNSLDSTEMIRRLQNLQDAKTEPGQPDRRK